MNNKDGAPIAIRCISRANGRRYHRDLPLDIKSVGVSTRGWLATALKQLAIQSIEHPIAQDYLWGVIESAKILASIRHIKKIIDKKASKTTRHEIKELFSNLDDFLLQSERSTPEVKKKFSYNFRNFVFRYGFPNHPTISTDSVNYKSKIGNLRSLPRKLLNDSAFESAAEHLGAISHSSYQDLIEKSLAKLKSDLQTIIDACLAEINTFERIRQHLLEASAKPTPKQYISYINRYLNKKATTSLDHKNYESIPKEFKLSSYVIALAEKQCFRANCSWRSYNLKDLLTEEIPFIDPNINYRHIMALPHRLCTAELQAIFILILCRTGWNKNSLYNTDLGMINKDTIKGHYEIQGYKGKTDDLTPPAFIRKSDKETYDAITKLLWNHQQLINFGYIPESEQRLWFAWTSDSKPYTEQSVSVQASPRAFCSRHNIFNFSLEQIRTQVGNIAHCSLKSAQSTQILYGHMQLSTTGHYLDNLLNSKLSSSINLEFQRRLEKKITFNMKHTTSSDLIAIGDGTLCTNPADHPFQDLIGTGMCDGDRCHAGDGCVNRRIFINEERLAELIKVRNFYQEHWKELYHENQMHFKITIAPKIIFYHALYEYISSSSHRLTLKKIEKALYEFEKGNN